MIDFNPTQSSLRERKLDSDKRGHLGRCLEEKLQTRIVGQGPGVRALVDAAELAMHKSSDTSRPIASMLFLGPTGCGKTLSVEELAREVYGDKRMMLKVDCAEFQHSHEIAKLVGSPPGYLGHRETGSRLTPELMLNLEQASGMYATSILLFDEIEKASDALWKLMLGILDKGELRLGDNRLVNLNRSIIIMTSNLGTHEVAAEAASIGFHRGAPRQRHGLVMAAAKKHFSAEFMNRIDRCIVFDDLSATDMQKVLSLELRKASDNMFGKVASTLLEQSAMTFLLNEGKDSRYGARHLRRAVESYLTAPLVRMSLSGEASFGDTVTGRASQTGQGLDFFVRVL